MALLSLALVWLISTTYIAHGFQSCHHRYPQFNHQRQHHRTLHQSCSLVLNRPRSVRAKSTNSKTPFTGASSTSRLNAVPGLTSSPLGALAVLGSIVVIHESGHYLAARAFNITVEEFSIGFGQKIFGFEKFGNEFNLRLLPLGGYVRFPENYDRELFEEQEQRKRDARSKIRKLEAAQSHVQQQGWDWKEEVLDAATLGFWKERKSDNDRKKRNIERKLKEEAQLLQLESTPWWKRLFMKKNTGSESASMNNDSNGDDSKNINKLYEELDDLESLEIGYSDDPKLLQNRPWQERAIVLSGGVIFNLLLAFGIYFGSTIGPLSGDTANAGGIPRAIYGNGVIVSKVNPGPSQGFIRNGDIIASINGHPVQIGSQKTSATAGQKQVTDVISTIRMTPAGESISFQLLRTEAGIPRGEEEISSDTSIRSSATATGGSTTVSKTVSIRPQSMDGTTQTIGVMLGPNVEKIERLQSNNPIVAFKLAWEYLSDIFTQTLVGTLSALSSFVLRSDPVPGQKISGPIGLIQQGSSVVATKDWTVVWLFAAGLSVNLGVINALPIPALDGGQLVFVIAEAITGKKVDQRFQENVTSIAVLFLLWLSFSAAVGDVGSLISGIR